MAGTFGRRKADRPVTRKDRVRRGRAFAGLERLEGRTLMAGAVLYRINAGGPSLSGNPSWAADTSSAPSGYSNASAARSDTSSTSSAVDVTDPSIPAGTPPALFQADRWDRITGEEMQWSFPVTPGPYEVRLYFAETDPALQAAGRRAFDVALEGAKVLDNYDVYADVGGYKGVAKSFVVSSDATLNVGLIHEIADPSIKGIEILAAQESNQLAASPGPLLFDSVLVGQSASRTVTLTNLGA